ncbi:hypothetical protein GCM10009663_59060 [Kitasatospora arboriphila]|uniref:Uncharacterized protein n=1 Tax=Kitasatospora arboriphila TaxID=258052 RepID=A0ABN1U0U4_9ACTN
MRAAAGRQTQQVPADDRVVGGLPHPPRPTGRRRERPMRFEILRLDDASGVATDRLIVDAETVGQYVKDAAATGERLYIRPCKNV